jgi:tetratricopeptide (TPR) repeat protein
MDAIISGRAGVALLVDGEVLSSFDVEDPGTLMPRRPADLRLLFGEAPDVQFLEGVNRDEAARHLELAFNCASALDLDLILFDAELTDDVRDDAADELDRLLSDPPVVEYLENILFGKPLPAAADIAGALARCEGKRLPRLSSTLQLLEGYQPSIRAVCAQWDALPQKLFGGEERKAEFQRVAVREGLFRQLAIEVANGPRARINEFIVRSGINHSITSLRSYREVLQQWVGPFRPHADAPRVRHEVEVVSEEASQTRRGKRGRRRRKSAEEELNKLQGQLDLIVSAMWRRDFAFARKITDEVIDYQLKNARPIHVAKTLCNLATEAKALGLFPLQFELTERAIQIAPDDGWSWAQYADALLNLQRPAEALKAYEQAESFGKGVVARSGRAETLRAMGRFDEALAAYDTVLANNTEDAIARNGRSGVLLALRRYDEALESLPDKLPITHNDWVGYHIRGMILLRKSRIDEAIRIFEHGVKEDPIPSSKEYFRTALAVACLRRKDYRRAESALAGISTPLLQPQANVLRLHTFGASGKDAPAAAAYEKLGDKPWFIPDQLVAELHRRYVLKEEPRHDDEWVFEQEEDMFLFDPNQQVLSFASTVA